MLAAERRDLLVTRLRRDGKLVARDLATELGLSEDSVRRDLRELAAAGLCQRVYGGALPVSQALGTLKARTEIAPESKRRIAARAAEMITPGMTAILDSGTTAIEIARALRPDLAATIITHSPTTAAALAEHPTVDVFILGGRLFKHSVAACGAAAAEAAAAVSADLYFLGLGGIHPKEGLTTGDPDEAAMKRLLVSRAADTYVVGSTEKLGAVCSYQVVRLSETAGVITDAPGDAHDGQPAPRAGHHGRPGVAGLRRRQCGARASHPLTSAMPGNTRSAWPSAAARVGRGDGEHGHAGPLGGKHAHRGVLDHDALRRGNAEGRGRSPVRLGVGLAEGHVVGGDKDFRLRQADRGQPGGGERPRPRRDHRPAPLTGDPDALAGAGQQRERRPGAPARSRRQAGPAPPRPGAG